MQVHEARKKKERGLFDLIVDSITDDEEVFEAQILVNGDEDFRLEVEEKSEPDGREVRVSIYRSFSEGNIHSSLNAELDYEICDAGYSVLGDGEGKAMTIEEVYEEVMRLLRRVEKVRL